MQIDFIKLKLKLTLDVDDPRYLMALKYKIIIKCLISRDLLKQRHIKNQERFIARRFGVIVTPLSRD